MDKVKCVKLGEFYTYSKIYMRRVFHLNLSELKKLFGIIDRMKHNRSMKRGTAKGLYYELITVRAKLSAFSKGKSPHNFHVFHVPFENEEQFNIYLNNIMDELEVKIGFLKLFIR